MQLEQVKEIANAVLYEAYLLYPYRHSAIKNRQRWSFGLVYPREYGEVSGGTEPWTMHTECLVAGEESKDTSVDVYIRFLHLLTRTSNEMKPSNGNQQSPDVGTGSIFGQLAYEPWEEGMEREVSVLNLSLQDLVAHPRHVEIAFAAQHVVEQEDRGQGSASTQSIEVVREQQTIAGAAIIAAERVGTNLFKVSISIENTTPLGEDVLASLADPNVIHRPPTLQSFVSTHTILQVNGGTFISLLEPPEEFQPMAKACQNLHTWPVLVGQEGERHTMLSSPIILYDYPQIAPESPGALFDGTEIDEILILRILTLSDEEKAEIRRGDPRAREVLERAESLTPEQFMKLHGVIRDLRPVDM